MTSKMLLRRISKPLLKLKALRVEHQLSQIDLAKELGISKGNYAQKENGITVFTLEECCQISKIFNEPLRTIFDGYFDGSSDVYF